MTTTLNVGPRIQRALRAAVQHSKGKCEAKPLGTCHLLAPYVVGTLGGGAVLRLRHQGDRKEPGYCAAHGADEMNRRNVQARTA